VTEKNNTNHKLNTRHESRVKNECLELNESFYFYFKEIEKKTFVGELATKDVHCAQTVYTDYNL
jgi:hypothetical protein